MGLTPSGGIIMATRSGNLDPGILIYLLREKGVGAAELEHLIDHQSGLLGISGLSGDLRELHEAEASSPDARLAIAMFCLSVTKEIAGMIAALGGVDTIVFTGGIGKHDAAVRATICRHLEWAGVRLDKGRNEAAVNRIDDDHVSCCRLYVLPSREDEQIAWHTSKLLSRRPTFRSLRPQPRRADVSAEPYRSTPVFTAETLPQALRQEPDQGQRVGRHPSP
jgi:acetate kinase